MSGQWIGIGRAQAVNKVNRMNLHRLQNVKLIGVGANDLEHTEESQDFSIERLLRAAGLDDPGIQSDALTSKKMLCKLSVAVGLVLVTRIR